MLTGAVQATRVTDNLIGAGYVGFSIFAENHEGLLITANNIFPRGSSAVHLKIPTAAPSPPTGCTASTPA